MPRSPARLAIRRWLVRLATSAFAAVVCGSAASARAQSSAGEATDSGPVPLTRALLPWLTLDAPPGHEARGAAIIRDFEPAWRPDGVGNLILTAGSGAPRRVVACGLDLGPAFVVSEITDAGYLRLHRAGSARAHPLWDQLHEGQQLRVLTRRGEVPAVSAVRSTHLARGSGAQDPPGSVADLWVDVGARSRADVAALGIRLLDPIVRDWPAWTFADVAAGPRAASRIACAAVAAAATAAPASGETTYIVSALSSFGFQGLLAAMGRLGRVDSITLVLPATSLPLPPALRWERLSTIGIPARFAGTTAESVREADIDSVHRAVERAAGNARTTRLIPLLRHGRPPRDLAWWAVAQPDSVGRAAALLGRLAKAVGVSGHERAVREAVRAELPTWAAKLAEVDTAGNLIVAAGPDRDTVVFVAHLDEVGFEVTGFDRAGVVSLRSRGGFYPSLWEGQPAELHVDDAGAAPPLLGVFVPRDSADVRQPRALTAWFGVDSAQLAARGVSAGQQVVAYKHPKRLAGTRMTARAVDDRAGTAAQVMALRQLDPARLRRKVIVAWSVREETGLEGARVLAERFGRSTRRVYAVDTFVSSDSPLESSRFAHTPLGRGAVVRALDNSSVTPPDEVDRVTAAARRAGIPIQVGTTNGGNDGSVFVRYGAVDIPLSWPGRYSHSPVEVLDLLDLLALSRLVRTLAEEP
jgi:putative aminopeptidase